MLVLSRKRNESVVIGEAGEIVVTIIEVRGDKVRLGITAPKTIPVHRDEVMARILENPKKRQAPTPGVSNGPGANEPD